MTTVAVHPGRSAADAPSSGGLVTTAARLYAEGLRALAHGRPHGLTVRDHDGRTAPLDLDDWHQQERPGDAGLLARCAGPTLDAGCGPGRLAAALAARGLPVLGIDIIPAAVASVRRRGATALRRSMFSRLPGEGRWAAVLLADGNVGIGGDPSRTLRRAATLTSADGRILVELAAPGSTRRFQLRLEQGDRHSQWLDWAQLGADDAPTAAASARLVVRERWEEHSRWFATLVHA